VVNLTAGAAAARDLVCKNARVFSPELSVCIPCYNGAAHLGAALASVCAQTISSFEIVVVDDASSDDSVAIVAAVNDRRIRLLRNDRTLGIPMNWNRALSEAAGEYVCMFHQDDLMHPDNLQRKIAILDRHRSVTWVHSAIELLEEPEVPRPFTTGWLEQSPIDFIEDGETYFRRLIVNGNLVCAPSVVARRRALLEAGAFNDDLRFACDYEMWLKLCVLGQVAYIADPLVVYRWHASNATHNLWCDPGPDDVHRAAINGLDFVQQRRPHFAHRQLLQQTVDALTGLRRQVVHLTAALDCRNAEWDAGPRAVIARREPADRQLPPADWHPPVLNQPPARQLRLRVLLVIHGLPPLNKGGSEIHVAHLAGLLAARHEVAVFCVGGSGDQWQITHELRGGYDVYAAQRRGVGAADMRAAYDEPAIEELFMRVLEEMQPDVVHFHATWRLSNSLPAVARRCLGTRGRIVFTLHDFWLMCPRGQRLRPVDSSLCTEIDFDRCAACLEPWINPSRVISPRRAWFHLMKGEHSPATLFNRALDRALAPDPTTDALNEVRRYHARTSEIFQVVDWFLAPSRFLLQEFIAYGAPVNRIARGDTGIDTTALSSTKTPSDALRFGFVGSLIPSKGVHVLIDAFHALAPAPAQARLNIFGGPPHGDPGVYAAELRARARHAAIAFRGPFDPEQVRWVFREIDVLVVPSLWYENAPLTIQEAFATGTPVIAANHGGMAEHVQHGRDGLLFPPGDARALKETLARLIESPDLRQSLRSGIQPVRRGEENAVDLERLYERLLELPACGAPNDRATRVATAAVLRQS
jgi:glycosyltransferase involved in cell wall biosynthesis